MATAIDQGELLVADAILDVEGKRVRAVDLVLGPGGPLLPAQGMEWLKAIGENPLSLYEVQHLTPGEGLDVKDLLRSDAPVVKVTERSASKSLVKRDIFGARIARRPDSYVLTGAIYTNGPPLPIFAVLASVIAAWCSRQPPPPILGCGVVKGVIDLIVLAMVYGFSV